jgi:hypothetical protein
MKVNHGQVTADGMEGTRVFTLAGLKSGNRMRLLKKYKDSPSIVAMHLSVANRTISGIWSLTGTHDGVFMYAV